MSYLACPKCGNNKFVGEYVAEIGQKVQLTKRDEHTLWEWGDEVYRESQSDDEIKTVYCRDCDDEVEISDLVE